MKSDTEKLDKFAIISPKSAKNLELSQLNLWQKTVSKIAISNWWQMFLIAVGSASSIIYPHVPLVGFAAVSGNTLTRKKALITTMSIWLTNQLYGFTIRQYPPTLESLTWGLVMGLGILLVTYLVTLKPKFSRHNFQGYLLWLAIAIVGGYFIYQGSILLIAQLMGGHEFSSAILWGIFVKDVIWSAALSGVHGCALLMNKAIAHSR
ncbi:MAG: hypothetical protein AAFW67_07360 [Cyanobacteria bacterium J06638_38]